MTHTLTTPDAALPAWNLRLKQFNDGSGQPPIMLAEFLQLLHDEETARHVATKATDDKEALASDERLIALGKAVAAQPEKFDAVEAAVTQILQA